MNRRELTRGARIRIFRDLVPGLLADLIERPHGEILFRQTGPSIDERLEQVYREAVLAGRRERELALEAVQTWRKEDPPPPEPIAVVDRHGDIAPNIEATIGFYARRDRVHALLVALEEHVGRKIR